MSLGVRPLREVSLMLLPAPLAPVSSLQRLGERQGEERRLDRPIQTGRGVRCVSLSDAGRPHCAALSPVQRFSAVSDHQATSPARLHSSHSHTALSAAGVALGLVVVGVGAGFLSQGLPRLRSRLAANKVITTTTAVQGAACGSQSAHSC